MSQQDHLYVIDGGSAAGTLQECISEGKLPPGKIAVVYDALAFGPLSFILNLSSRIDWLNGVTVNPGEDDDWSWIGHPWDQIANWQGAVTVFWSRYSAFEHTLYLILAKHMPHAADFDFIDVSRLESRNIRFLSTGELNVELMAASYKLKRRLAVEEIDGARKKLMNWHLRTSQFVSLRTQSCSGAS